MKLKYLWYVKCRPVVYILFSGFLFCCSTIVIIIQVLNFAGVKFEITIELVRSVTNFIVVNLMVLVPLLYLSVCVYYGLFSIKINSWYELTKHHSDPMSIVWSA